MVGITIATMIPIGPVTRLSRFAIMALGWMRNVTLCSACVPTQPASGEVGEMDNSSTEKYKGTS